MRTTKLAALAIGLLGAAPAFADEGAAASSAASAVSVMANASSPVIHTRHNAGSHAGWNRRVNGRWWAGWNAPGGWSAYRRPVVGWVLPTYWINRSYYIPDYRAYALPAPAYGYGWSRYYDDAVMTDRWGRVIDVRHRYDWDRYDRYYNDGGYADSGYGYGDSYHDRRDGRRTGQAVAGAVAGGLIGGIAGSAIAGRGNRGVGAVLGAGVGAVAGAAIANSAGKRRDRGAAYDYRDRDRGRGDARYDQGGYAGYGDDVVTADGGNAAYDGRWVGTWYGRDGNSYSGEYEGRFSGDAYAAPASGGPALPYRPMSAYGYSIDGQYYEGASGGVTAYRSADYLEYTAPVVTTMVTEETVYSKVRTAAKRRAVVHKPRALRARAQPRCTCSCRC